VPHLRDLPVLYRLQHRALRLGQVAAVVVLAAAQIRLELHESALQHAFRQVVQAELLEARRIDDRRTARQPVQTGEGRGVLAGVERRGDLAHGDVGVRHQQVDERRLAHARLADEDRMLAGQQRLQHGQGVLRIGFRRDLVYRIAERTVDGGAFARARQRLLHVGLVENQMGLDPGRLGRDERARDQVVGEARFGGDDDEQARDVRRQQLRLVLVGAVDQGGAVGDLLDHGLVVRGLLQVHHVAHRHIGFLAARDALVFRALDVGQVVAAVRRDDGAVHAHALRSS